jgi:phospholipase C
MSPEELLAGIDTFVVLYMENHSFDSMLGSLKLVEGRSIDGLTGAESNLDPDGAPVGVYNLENFTPADPPHGWDALHADWNGGLNDGFVKQHAGASQDEAMGYYVRSQLPAIYDLADNFAVCDRWFSSLLGPTFPNRLYLHGATSNGLPDNLPAFGYHSFFETLDAAGIAATSYYHDLAFQMDYLRFTGLAQIEQFFADAAAGTLPRYSIIDPKYTGAGENDDHPNADVHLGQALIASIYAALAASPQWPRCLFVISYDENGGFYDHVPPPTTVDAFPGFEQLGFRVPAVVIGPTVKQGTVSTTFEHVSVISTVSKRFGLAPINDRVGATNDLSSCIDPAKVTAPGAAPRIKPVTISLSDMRAFAAKPKPRSQPELQDLADRGAIPRRLDRRGDTEITRRVLEYGRRLGAVRLID